MAWRQPLQTRSKTPWAFTCGGSRLRQKLSCRHSRRRGMADGPVVAVQLVVNGRQTRVVTHPLSRLLDVLRLDLHLTGTKEGCGEGECGACSVLINGDLVNSCLVPILQAEGTEITTIEGVSIEGNLHPIQQCFLEEGGAQCGI